MSGTKGYNILTRVEILGLTSLSLQEKSFFFLPGAQFSGLPAASVHRGNVKTCVCKFVSLLLYFCLFGNQMFFMHFCTLKRLRYQFGGFMKRNWTTIQQKVWFSKWRWNVHVAVRTSQLMLIIVVLRQHHLMSNLTHLLHKNSVSGQQSRHHLPEREAYMKTTLVRIDQKGGFCAHPLVTAQ